MKPKFSTNPNFIIQKIEGKTSIFDAEKSVLYTLNDEAAVIFRGFQLQWTKERIVKEIIISQRGEIQLLNCWNTLVSALPNSERSRLLSVQRFLFVEEVVSLCNLRLLRLFYCRRLSRMSSKQSLRAQ